MRVKIISKTGVAAPSADDDDAYLQNVIDILGDVGKIYEGAPKASTKVPPEPVDNSLLDEFVALHASLLKDMPRNEAPKHARMMETVLDTSDRRGFVEKYASIFGDDILGKMVPKEMLDAFDQTQEDILKTNDVMANYASELLMRLPDGAGERLLSNKSLYTRIGKLLRGVGGGTGARISITGEPRNLRPNPSSAIKDILMGIFVGRTFRVFTARTALVALLAIYELLEFIYTLPDTTDIDTIQRGFLGSAINVVGFPPFMMVGNETTLLQSDRSFIEPLTNVSDTELRNILANRQAQRDELMRGYTAGIILSQSALVTAIALLAVLTFRAINGMSTESLATYVIRSTIQSAPQVASYMFGLGITTAAALVSQFGNLMEIVRAAGGLSNLYTVGSFIQWAARLSRSGEDATDVDQTPFSMILLGYVYMIVSLLLQVTVIDQVAGGVYDDAVGLIIFGLGYSGMLWSWLMEAARTTMAIGGVTSIVLGYWIIARSPVYRDYAIFRFGGLVQAARAPFVPNPRAIGAADAIIASGWQQNQLPPQGGRRRSQRLRRRPRG